LRGSRTEIADVGKSTVADYNLSVLYVVYRRRSENLDDIANVRKRPGMYAGSIPDGTALHNLVLGTVTFAMARTRSHPSFDTKVVLHNDSSVTVCFAGPEEWDEANLAALSDARRRAATSIADGIRHEPDAVDVEGGIWCDLCVVNALSDWMCDQVWSGELVQTQMFRDGAFEATIRTPLFPEVIFEGHSGLSTTFLPSDKIFPSITFDAGRLRASLSNICAQNVGARVGLVDGR